MLFTEVFFVGPGPLLPFLHNLFTVKQHTAEDNAGGPPAPFLSVVNLKGFSNVLGQGAIEFMFKFVDIVLCASFAQIFFELFVVVFEPSVDSFPGVRDGRWGRNAFLEILHLNFAITHAVGGIGRIGLT